ncbi:MAG TPA: shikimate dehydrogenase [Thermodesulfobacteriota bacterium]
MLTGSTRVVGILGHPVEHSLSPRMQNAAFAACGLDWVYVPLPVRPEALPEAVAGLVALGFAGANVTIPHKTAVVPLCDEVDDVATRAGSVNTLVVRDGRVHGSSTDGLAVTGAVECEGAHALLLGAGGAAQAVAAALLDAGVGSLTVSARRPEGARRLLDYLRPRFPDADLRQAERWPPDADSATLLVNATPLKEELPVAPAARQAVVDLAYRPDGKPTALVAAAQEAGCATVVDGLEVLVRQGAASFERWTGVEAPIEAMRAAVRSVS